MKGLVSLFYIPSNIFDHNNGIIDNKARRNSEGHQGEVVETKSQEVHSPEGADKGKGYGDAWNERGRKVAEKKEDDEYHQSNRKHQLELNIPH